jgi:hypothetical protein
VVRITDELNSKLKYNALTIGVYGMIESKRKDILAKQQANLAEDAELQEEQDAQASNRMPTDSAAQKKYISDMNRKVQDLEKALAQARHV